MEHESNISARAILPNRVWPIFMLVSGTSQDYSLTLAQGQIGVEPFDAATIIKLITISSAYSNTNFTIKTEKREKNIV